MAVDDELGSVDPALFEGRAIGTLTGRVRGAGERIGPAEVVPVIDVELEGDDVGARDGLTSRERGEERIGGRAARAAFGGEELEDHRLALPGRGGVGGALRGRSAGGESSEEGEGESAESSTHGRSYGARGGRFQRWFQRAAAAFSR